MWPFSTLLVRATARTLRSDLLKYKRIMLNEDICIKYNGYLYSIPKGTTGIVINNKAHFLDDKGGLCLVDYRWIEKISQVPIKKSLLWETKRNISIKKRILIMKS